MTTQILSRPSSENRQQTLSPSEQPPLKMKSEETQMTQVKKSYQALQQLEYLHLQAEIDVLLQQLQALKQD